MDRQEKQAYNPTKTFAKYTSNVIRELMYLTATTDIDTPHITPHTHKMFLRMKGYSSSPVPYEWPKVLSVQRSLKIKKCLIMHLRVQF